MSTIWFRIGKPNWPRSPHDPNRCLEAPKFSPTTLLRPLWSQLVVYQIISRSKE